MGEVANRYEGGQHAHGGRGDGAEAACTYRSRALYDSAGESGDSHVLVPIPCAHEGFVHVRCMLYQADRVASGHTDPRPCVACQSAWAEGIRPPHPPELTRGLPTTERGGRWAAGSSAIQIAALLQQGDLGTEPARYVATGVHNTFELIVSTLGRSPFSSFVPCPFSVMRWTYLKGLTSIFPVQENGRWLPPTTVRCSPRTSSGTVLDPRIYTTPKSETLRWTLRSRVFGGP